MSAGLGPFIATGGLGAFVTFGLSPFVALDYELGSRLAAGVYVGATGFLASGPLEDGQGVLASGGLDVRYQSDLGSVFVGYLRLAGGPALFAVDTESSGLVAKLVPFATLGAGVTRMFSERSGLSFDAAYAAYLESGELFQGVVPSLNLLKRL